jgi:hypothetical protein
MREDVAQESSTIPSNGYSDSTGIKSFFRSLFYSGKIPLSALVGATL